MFNVTKSSKVHHSGQVHKGEEGDFYIKTLSMRKRIAETGSVKPKSMLGPSTQDNSLSTEPFQNLRRLVSTSLKFMQG
jgi:hypothetical protein